MGGCRPRVATLLGGTFSFHVIYFLQTYATDGRRKDGRAYVATFFLVAWHGVWLWSATSFQYWTVSWLIAGRCRRCQPPSCRQYSGDKQIRGRLPMARGYLPYVVTLCLTAGATPIRAAVAATGVPLTILLRSRVACIPTTYPSVPSATAMPFFQAALFMPSTKRFPAAVNLLTPEEQA